MIRIIEILIAANAIAGIAAFLGARHFVRKTIWKGLGREEETPSPEDSEEEEIARWVREYQEQRKINK